MADLLGRASDWLESQRTRFATRLVIYQRGDQQADVAATVGKTVFDLDDGAGAVVIREESRDYLILTADLPFGLPERGDRIGEAQGGQTFIYEVVGPGHEPCWRYSDPNRKTVRVHTKQTDIDA
jgi:hypothetical protein